MEGIPRTVLGESVRRDEADELDDRDEQDKPILGLGGVCVTFGGASWGAIFRLDAGMASMERGERPE